MNKKRGRGRLLENSKVIESLHKIIVEFDEKHNLHHKVRIVDIFEHVMNLYKNNKIDFKAPSHTWWKTTGKIELLDKYNQSKMNSVFLIEKETFAMPDLICLAEKYGGVNKELWRKELTGIETVLKSWHIKFEKKIDQLSLYEGQIANLKAENLKLIETNNKLQMLLLELFTYSERTDNPLINLVDMSKNKNNIITKSMESTFGNPMLYISSLIRNLDVNLLNSWIEELEPIKKSKINEKIIPLSERPPKNIFKW